MRNEHEVQINKESIHNKTDYAPLVVTIQCHDQSQADVLKELLKTEPIYLSLSRRISEALRFWKKVEKLSMGQEHF
jgi:hypothetical protein